jgi:hypothetical protein
MISMVFSFLTFQSGVVMCLMVVLRRFPSSSHSSSTSILVLSPFLFSVASHSFCGGAHPFPWYASRTCFTPGAGATYDFGAAAGLASNNKLCSGAALGVGAETIVSGASLVFPLEPLVVVVVVVGLFVGDTCPSVGVVVGAAGYSFVLTAALG